MISDGLFLFFWIDFAITEFAFFILILGRLNRVQTAFLLA
mgnify:CR=1 FL=1